MNKAHTGLFALPGSSDSILLNVCVSVCHAPASPHLLIGSPTPSHEHHVETCESHDWNEEKPCYTHYHQTGQRSRSTTTTTTIESTQEHENNPDYTDNQPNCPLKNTEVGPGSGRIRDSGVQRSQPLSVVEHEDETEGKNSNHVDAQ